MASGGRRSRPGIQADLLVAAATSNEGYTLKIAARRGIRVPPRHRRNHRRLFFLRGEAGLLRRSVSSAQGRRVAGLRSRRARGHMARRGHARHGVSGQSVRVNRSWLWVLRHPGRESLERRFWLPRRRALHAGVERKSPGPPHRWRCRRRWHQLSERARQCPADKRWNHDQEMPKWPECLT